jgi:hypothetical protein
MYFKICLKITYTLVYIYLCVYVFVCVCVGERAHSWETLATNRPLWRGKITSGSRVAKRHKINEAQIKRVDKKSKESKSVVTNTNHPYTI